MENQLPPTTPPYSPSPNPLSDADARLYGMLAHISGIIASFMGGMTFLGPLLVWLIFKDRSAFVDYHGKEALNFSISMTLIYVALIVATVLTCGISAFLIPAVGVFQIVFNVIAGMKAYNGELYQYPVNWRLVK